MPFDVAGARKEGYSDSDIAEFLSKQNRFNLTAARKEGYTDTDIVGFLTKQAPKQATDVPGNEGALAGDRNKDKGMGFLDTIKAIPEAVVAAGQGTMAGLAGRAVGLVNPAAGVALEQKMSPTPSEPAQNLLETVGGALEKAKVPEVWPAAGPLQASRGIPAAAQQAGRGVARVVGEVAEIPGKAVAAITPMPEPRVAALAKKAVDLGIPLRPDQLSKNPVARMVGEALEKVPLSGSKAKQRQIGFNKALGSMIGAEDADHLTPDVFANAMEKSGGKIGDIAKETPIAVDPAQTKVFSDRLEYVKKFETRDVARVVGNYIKELSSKVENGVLDGETFKRVNSQLGKQIRTSEGDMKRALSELQDDMHDALQKNIKSPERLQELQQARKQYAIGKTIEPLVAKATTTGDISPGGLLGRVTADKAGKNRMAMGRGGELGDLAEIGKLFLKEPQSSGTAERALAYGAIGGVGAVEPHTAAGAITAANIYNRLGPKITERALRNVESKKAESRPAKKREKRTSENRQYLLKEAISEPVKEEPVKKVSGGND